MSEPSTKLSDQIKTFLNALIAAGGSARSMSESIAGFGTNIKTACQRHGFAECEGRGNAKWSITRTGRSFAA